MTHCSGRMLFVASAWLLSVVQASAQCALTGSPSEVATLDDRQIVSGDGEVIVNISQDGPGFGVGLAPKGSETSPNVPGGRRVIGGRDTFRYGNRSVPAGQTREMHIVAAGISPPSTVVSGTSKPIVLVIISNGETARWKLFVMPGTTLAKVVLQGMKGEVEGLPAGVEVVRREPCEWHTTGRGVRRQTTDIEYSPSRIRRVLADIRAFTGLVETTFQQGFAPASLVASTAPEAVLPVLDHLSAEQIARATDVKLLEYMDGVRARLPELVRPTVSLLIDLVRKSRLPAATFTENGERLPLLWYPPQMPFAGSKLECTSNVLIGQGPVRSVACKDEPRIYFMEGKGRSTIRESAGNSLFVPGRGSSFISAGSGRDLIVLERGWGIASVSKACAFATSRLRGRRPPLGMIHTGTIVFGMGIKPADLLWLPMIQRGHGPRTQDPQLAVLQTTVGMRHFPSRVLVNRATRDILILRQSCFNFVFAEKGRLAASRWSR